MTAMLQLVNKLATSLLRTHLDDKLRGFYVCWVNTAKLIELYSMNIELIRTLYNNMVLIHVFSIFKIV